MLILSYVFDLDNKMIMLLMKFEEKLKKETMTLLFFSATPTLLKKNPISPALAEAMAPVWFLQLSF